MVDIAIGLQRSRISKVVDIAISLQRSRIYKVVDIAIGLQRSRISKVVDIAIVITGEKNTSCGRYGSRHFSGVDI